MANQPRADCSTLPWCKSPCKTRACSGAFNKACATAAHCCSTPAFAADTGSASGRLSATNQSCTVGSCVANTDCRCACSKAAVSHTTWVACASPPCCSKARADGPAARSISNTPGAWSYTATAPCPCHHASTCAPRSSSGSRNCLSMAERPSGKVTGNRLLPGRSIPSPAGTSCQRASHGCHAPTTIRRRARRAAPHPCLATALGGR